jgi:hypothetical protein
MIIWDMGIFSGGQENDPVRSRSGSQGTYLTYQLTTKHWTPIRTLLSVPRYIKHGYRLRKECETEMDTGNLLDLFTSPVSVFS